MKRVMLEEPTSEGTRSLHECCRRDCSRVFRDGYGYSDYVAGQFDLSRPSSRECPVCGGTLYLAKVNQTLKVEAWVCAEIACSYAEDILSPSAR